MTLWATNLVNVSLVAQRAVDQVNVCLSGPTDLVNVCFAAIRATDLVNVHLDGPSGRRPSQRSPRGPSGHRPSQRSPRWPSGPAPATSRLAAQKSTCRGGVLFYPGINPPL